MKGETAKIALVELPEPRQVFRRQPLPAGRDIVLDLSDGADAGDYRRNGGLAQEKSQRRVSQIRDVAFDQKLQLRNGGVDLRQLIVREDSSPPVPVGKSGCALEAARERPALQRHSRDDADTFPLCEREKALLGVLMQDVVHELERIRFAGLDRHDPVVGLLDRDAIKANLAFALE